MKKFNRLTKRNPNFPEKSFMPFLPNASDEDENVEIAIKTILFVGQTEDLLEESNMDWDDLFELMNDLGGNKDVLSS